jgi:hypothetical protein
MQATGQTSVFYFELMPYGQRILDERTILLIYMPYGQRILDERTVLLIYMPYGQRILDVRIILLKYMPYGQFDFPLGKQCQ